MWKVLKIELKRSLFNKWTLISFLVTSGFCVLHFIDVYEARMEYFAITEELGYTKALNVCSSSAYEQWILYQSNMYGYVLIFVMAIIAVLPFGASFYADMKSGYIKQIVSRITMKNYTRAKYIATFISGGTVVVAPVLLEILAIATIYPVHKPYRLNMTMWGEETFLIDLFYEHPMIFTLFKLLLVFIVAGLLATMALLVSKYISNYFSVVITPFIFTFMLSLSVSIVELNEVSFAYSLQARSHSYNYGILFTEIILMFLVTYFGFVGSRKEVY